MVVKILYVAGSNNMQSVLCPLCEQVQQFALSPLVSQFFLVPDQSNEFIDL
jgi:hypothetical protein